MAGRIWLSTTASFELSSGTLRMQAPETSEPPGLRYNVYRYAEGRPGEQAINAVPASGTDRVLKDAEIREEVEFLRANVLMALGRPSEAVEVLRRLQGSDEFNGFSAYNLGIALLQDGRPAEALQLADAFVDYRAELIRQW